MQTLVWEVWDMAAFLKAPMMLTSPSRVAWLHINPPLVLDKGQERDHDLFKQHNARHGGEPRV